MRRTIAGSLLLLCILSGCSDSDTPEKGTDTSQSADQEQSNSGEDESPTTNTMSVKDDVATSSDGLFTLTLPDGWEPYPGELQGRTNITLVRSIDSNNAKIAANVFGTFIKGKDLTLDDWQNKVHEQLASIQDVHVKDGRTLTIDGQQITGLEVHRAIDGKPWIQVVYPVKYSDGIEELAFSAPEDVFKDNRKSAEGIIASLHRSEK